MTENLEKYKKALEELNDFMFDVSTHLPKKKRGEEAGQYIYDFSKQQVAIFEHLSNVFYDICRENDLPYLPPETN